MITVDNSQGSYRGERSGVGLDLLRLEFLVKRSITGIDTTNGVVEEGTPAQSWLEAGHAAAVKKLLNYGCWGQILNQGIIPGRSLSKTKYVTVLI